MSEQTRKARLIEWLAFGFGSGYAPKAPGTFGTVAAIPIYLLVADLSLISYLVVVLLMAVIGIYLCGEASRQLGVNDHPGIVWDEIVGFLITMTAIPLSWEAVLLGFLLFRLFDIVKPWPIKWIDKRIHGGLGIMLDDILAGIFAGAVLHFVLAYL